LELFAVFKPDQVGTWFVRAAFAGLKNEGTYYTAANATQQWPIIVTQEQQPLPNSNIVTKGYVGTAPSDKIGTGNAIYIVGWVSPARELKGGIYHVDYTFTITKPDGTTENVLKKPDSPATASFSYVCTQAGTYSVQLSFPGDVYPTFKFLPCTSKTATWTVENNYVVPTYPDEPVPSSNFQWKYPINGEFYQWYQISGAWPTQIGGQGSARYDASGSTWNPYTQGPNSAHVIWAQNLNNYMGGIMGGVEPDGGGTKSLSTNIPSFVSYQGYLWYTTTQQVQSTTVGTVPTSQPVVVMVDQYTGKEVKRQVLPGTGSVSLWLELSPREKIDPRQEEAVGVTTNLWAIGNGLRLLNPWTLQCSYYNSTFTPKFYHGGYFYAVLDYSSTGGEQWIYKWSTADRTDIWRVPAGRVYNSGAGFYLDTDVTPNRLVMACRSFGMWPISTYIKSWNAETGQIICNATNPTWYATEALLVNEVGWGGFYFHDYSGSVICVDTATGKEKWRSEPQIMPWGDFNAYNMARGYHLIYSNSWDGYQYAYVAETGELAWKAFSAVAYQETAMGVYAWWGQTIVGDQKCYTATAQHTQPSPPSRGDALYCINALTGEQMWKLGSFQNGGGQSLASGILTYGNAYDGMVYAFAKGSSQVTVTCPENAVAANTPVLIKGTIMDMSPGRPNTPAVSDASQAQWVQYLYMNKPKPANATGVPVFLQAINTADGTITDIWHAQSDTLGHWEYAWTPTVAGTYKILATFEGSDSYYSSSEETALVVIPASSPAPSASALPTLSPTVAPTAPASSPPASPIIEQAVAPLMLVVAVAAIVVIVIAATVALARRRKK